MVVILNLAPIVLRTDYHLRDTSYKYFGTGLVVSGKDSGAHRDSMCGLYTPLYRSEEVNGDSTCSPSDHWFIIPGILFDQR